jgi:thiosulfate/3-mercaptopyruvate sulfurtransferase
MAPKQGKLDYIKAHIPGSFFLNVDDKLCSKNLPKSNGRHPLPNKVSFRDSLNAFGAKNDSFIVGVDNSGGVFASRLWWMCRWIGHMNCGILNGGISAWIAEGGDLDSGLVDKKLNGSLSSRPTLTTDWDIQSIKSWVKNGSNREIFTLLDARANERFKGEVEPIDPKAGHIPGAINRPFTKNLDITGKFKTAIELRTEFESLLKNKYPTSVVHTCGSGITACHNLIAMESAGLIGSSLFVGSWSQWCNQSIDE